MDKMLASLKCEVQRLAAKIDAPRDALPTYVISRDFGYPHIEREGDKFCYVVVERGVEQSRECTTSRDEILYWIFYHVTFSMAADWEVAHRVQDQDFRIGLFTKQMELLGELDPVWLSRYRLENDRLAQVGLA